MISEVQSNMSMSSDMMLQMREEMFAKIDLNGDGQLDQDEIQQMMNQRPAPSEHALNAEEFLAQVDTDGDGVISKEEFEAMEPPKPPTYNLADIMGEGNSQESIESRMTGSLLDILS
nr:EF-hand domain-containing protein [candidate division Zixibacteria bacterium]